MNRQQPEDAAEGGHSPTGNPPQGAATGAVQPGVAELLAAGLAHHQAGRVAEAEVSYRQVLAAMPDHADALHLLGVIAYQFGQHQAAIQLIGRAIQYNGSDPSYYCSCGLVLQSLKRLDEAVASYDRALALKPDFAEALNNLGTTLQALARFDEALESYDRALALGPDYPAALNNRGNTLRQLARFDEALDSYDRALALKPDYAAALNNRGLALQQLGRFAEALESCDRALGVRPHYALALNTRGNALLQLGRFAEAVESYDRALAVRPDYAVAHSNRGTALSFLGKLNEAIVSFGQAAALQPDYAVAEWFNTRQIVCDWSSYSEGEARTRSAVKTRVSRSAPFALLALSSTPEEQLDCARQVAAGIAARASPMLPRAKPLPAERIRLGYLSADFRRHAVAVLLAGLIEHHDRRRFEVVGYSYGPDDYSALRARLERAFDRFVDIRDMPRRRAAELIHADAVDILIDLNGYTGDSRAEILTYRPALIQVNYLGFTATMGADFIDYIIVDPFVVPVDQQAFFSERLVHLPDCYQCNDDKREIAECTPSRAECGLPETGFVFCCFNNSYKITPAFFDIWMRLLAAVPDSVLWLLDPSVKGASSLVEANLAREAAARGVLPERLIFAPVLPLSEHLARHRCADLFLDTLPFNAHVTASDALWAGLPLLTCAGNTFVGRVAGSLSRAVGLGELVTTSLEEYEALALRLARDVGLLIGLRERLAQNRLTCSLFDTERYARNLETAYSRMWERWRAGRPPAAFSVL